MKLSNKWIGELGKLFVDVGKYIVTAVIIGSFLSDKGDVLQWLALVICLAIGFIAFGLLISSLPDQSENQSKPTEIKKANFTIQHADIHSQDDSI